ncbi:MAG: hypothetical protein VX246_08700 [Myxococcota bacterium]|nr:hypothetical protein [Myxococcota bacterium]
MPQSSPRFGRAAGVGLLVLALFCNVASAASNSSDDVPADAVVADLPFLSVPGSPRIHLDLAAPGDPPLPVILDTGFARTLASDAALRKIGETSSSVPYIRRNTALGTSIKITRSGIRNPDSRKHDWVRFGGEPLLNFILEIDFEKRRVRFLDRSKFSIASSAPSPDRTVLPIMQMAYRPFTEIEVNDRKVTVAIDTTVTLPVTIGARTLAKAAVHPKTLPVLRARGTQISTTRLFETDRVRIGPFDFGVLPVFIAPQGQVDAMGPSGPAIGLDMLMNFKVRLDLKGGELWLERTRTAPVGFGGVDYAHTRSSGLFLGPLGDQWVVLGVLPESPADKSGFLPADRIDRTDSEFRDSRRLQEAVRTQTPLTIQRRVGEQILELIAPTQTSHRFDASSTDAHAATPPLASTALAVR